MTLMSEISSIAYQRLHVGWILSLCELPGSCQWRLYAMGLTLLALQYIRRNRFLLGLCSRTCAVCNPMISMGAFLAPPFLAASRSFVLSPIRLSTGWSLTSLRRFSAASFPGDWGYCIWRYCCFVFKNRFLQRLALCRFAFFQMQCRRTFGSPTEATWLPDCPLALRKQCDANGSNGCFCILDRQSSN